MVKFEYYVSPGNNDPPMSYGYDMQLPPHFKPIAVVGWNSDSLAAWCVTQLRSIHEAFEELCASHPYNIPRPPGSMDHTLRTPNYYAFTKKSYYEIAVWYGRNIMDRQYSALYADYTNLVKAITARDEAEMFYHILKNFSKWIEAPQEVMHPSQYYNVMTAYIAAASLLKRQDPNWVLCRSAGFPQIDEAFQAKVHFHRGSGAPQFTINDSRDDHNNNNSNHVVGAAIIGVAFRPLKSLAASPLSHWCIATTRKVLLAFQHLAAVSYSIQRKTAGSVGGSGPPQGLLLSSSSSHSAPPSSHHSNTTTAITYAEYYELADWYGRHIGKDHPLYADLVNLLRVVTCEHENEMCFHLIKDLSRWIKAPAPEDPAYYEVMNVYIATAHLLKQYGRAWRLYSEAGFPQIDDAFENRVHAHVPALHDLVRYTRMFHSQ